MIGASSKRRLQLASLCLVAILLGGVWGARIYHERERRAGLTEPNVTLRVLTIKGLFPRELLARFEKTTGTHVTLTETNDPEELWEKLEAPPSAQNEGFDLVSLFSYQVPLAFQLSRAQPLKIAKIRGFSSSSPDLRELPGSSSFHLVVPLVWGLTGMAYDSQKTSEPESWDDALKNPKLKGKIALPSSTVEILRLLGPTAANEKGLKKALPALLSSARLAPNYLTPAELLAEQKGTSARPVVAMVSHGETAFAPWNTPEWKFTIPDEGATLWILSLALHSEMKNEASVYAFLDFLLARESAEAITASFHQASANRLLEASDLDARLKPSYLRQVSLSKVNLWKDFSRAREIRALLKNP